MYEREWPAVAPTLLTANGGTDGLVKVQDSAGIYVKQTIVLKQGATELQVQVKRFQSKNAFWVGRVDKGIGDRVDVSAFTTGNAAFVFAVVQPKNAIPQEDHYNAVWVQEPVVADRVLPVDQYGEPYSDTNPYPIAFDGTIEIGQVEVKGTNGNVIEPNTDGSINVVQTTAPLEPTIVNIPISLANTEQSFSFPANTRKFLLRIRDGDGKIKIAFVPGQSGTTYLTIGAGSYYSEDVNISGKSLYFQLTKPNKIIELLYWTQS